MMRRAASCALLLAALVAVIAPAPARAGGPAEQDLGIVILFDDSHGEEDLRRNFGANLLAEIEAKHCFRSVRILDSEPEGPVRRDDPEEPATPGPGLLLRIVISEIEEKMHWGVNIAQLSNPNRTPDTDEQVAVETEAAFLARLVTAEDDLLLREKFYRDRKIYRPRMHEDPRVASWQELVESAARTARRLVCGGSIEKDLRKARR